MFGEPASQLIFTHDAFGETEKGKIRIFARCFDLDPVQSCHS